MAHKASVHSHRVNDAFDDAEDEFGEDRSTEFLAQVVADRMGIQAHEVIDAIVDVSRECSGCVPWRYSEDKN